MLLANLVQSGLDVFHLVNVFYRTFFAGCNNQPLLAFHERNFGDALDRNKVLNWLCAHVDESAQAIVLAEIATRGFVARGAVLNLADRVQADESGLLAISPEPQCLLRGANSA